MEIKILGSGCPKCKRLEQATMDVVEAANISANIVKEEDVMAIMSYGVVRTPALVINDNVVISGRLPSVDELRDIISKHS